MQLAVPTTDEHQRLKALHDLHLLDTPREERFDRIVDLAADLFQAPIAYIALVDSDRQWLKAQCGLGFTESDRDTSFCGHTIQRGEPMVVPDAKADERFADNPMVVGDPFIRFYVGHPLTAVGGEAIGTLCLADSQPRTIDQQGLSRLERLARLAEHELRLTDLVTAQDELIRTKDELLQAQQALAKELQDAAAYVRGLLPAPVCERGVCVDWVFEACSDLGGDIFGFHWLDDTRLAVYLIDIMGHGVGAALLASNVQSALRREGLADTDYSDPNDVLASLNRVFPMHEHGGKFFTAFYGVYDTQNHRLCFANAGHPPGLLRDRQGKLSQLPATHSIVGVDVGDASEATCIQIEPGSQLLLYSDAAVELTDPQGNMAGGEVVESAWTSQPDVNEVRHVLAKHQGHEHFGDDLTLIGLSFD
ncbi:MAG: GAF domain-containing SpoIIE family protein phosphatase [Planctomycetota bacterium]